MHRVTTRGVFELTTQRENRMNETKSPFLTRREVAAYLRISQSTLCRMAKNGRLPALKIGGSMRYERATVERMLERERAAGAELAAV
jgi:excisionase family DNA binding protein